MLNQQSLPVWVLADSTMLLITVGGVVTTVIAGACLSLFGQTIHQQQAVLQQNETLLANEGAFRKELLCLSGSLEKAVFVIDKSSSMADATLVGATSERTTSWDVVIRRCEAWLKYLPVTQFRVICFDSSTQHFPAEKSMWLHTDDDRSKAVDYLKGQTAGGTTNTEHALTEALSFEPTCIVLITDGMPSDVEGNLDARQQTKILTDLSEAGVPIHVVAISNYFNAECSTFLRKLAAQSSGSFIGF